MECPKCHHSQGEADICQACGLVFAKYWAAQKEVSQPQIDTETATDFEINDLDALMFATESWVAAGMKRYGILLIVGFSLPLLKHSALMGESLILWPWDLLSGPSNLTKAAAMATESAPDNIVLWVLLPLIAGVVIIFLNLTENFRLKCYGSLLIGCLTLALMLTWLYQSAEILGLAFMPPTIAAGILCFINILCLAIIASVNHVKKQIDLGSFWHRSQWISGILLCLTALFYAFGSDRAWATIPMQIGYFLMFIIGANAIRHGFWVIDDETALKVMSLLIRATLVWVFVATLIAQTNVKDPYLYYVVQSGGGWMQVFISSSKVWLTYGVCCFVIAHCLSALIMIRNISTFSGDNYDADFNTH